MANKSPKHEFSAIIEIIGVNPFVFVPEVILQEIFNQAKKSRGTIPIKGEINQKPYTQTLVRYSGHWRLYINTKMLKDSPKHIGEIVYLTIEYDPESRGILSPTSFIKALNENSDAKNIFDNLPQSRKHEIVRYLANLKSQETLEKNVTRAINFLLGKERFVGRDKP